MRGLQLYRQFLRLAEEKFPLQEGCVVVPPAHLELYTDYVHALRFFYEGHANFDSLKAYIELDRYGPDLSKQDYYELMLDEFTALLKRTRAPPVRRRKRRVQSAAPLEPEGEVVYDFLHPALLEGITVKQAVIVALARLRSATIGQLNAYISNRTNFARTMLFDQIPQVLWEDRLQGAAQRFKHPEQADPVLRYKASEHRFSLTSMGWIPYTYDGIEVPHLYD